MKEVEAVVLLQAVLQTHLSQGKIERKKQSKEKKDQADMFYGQILVKQFFYRWKVSWEWKEHWRDKMLRKKLKYKHNVHRFLGKLFPAKEIFSREGKDAMAKEYYQWYVNRSICGLFDYRRMKAVFLVKWMEFMTRRFSEDQRQ